MLGLGSSFHCLGMCGGIISALSLGLPDNVRTNKRRSFFLISSYNLGRIGSYSLLGVASGFLASLAPSTENPAVWHFIVQCIASVFLICLGLHISGYLPQLKRIELLGLRVWAYIRPLGKRFLPTTTIPRALALGAIWGWLPCGLVYSALLWAVTANSPWLSAFYMFMFGLGTLPAMLISGLAGSSLLGFANSIYLKRLAGSVIVILGLSLLYLQSEPFFSAEPASHHRHH